jgi:MtN3 and saliva related transmembrane protein
MFLIFALGLVLWLWYGLAIGSGPIVVANAVTLALVAIILYFKVRYG